jgi:hypothetical protein
LFVKYSFSSELLARSDGIGPVRLLFVRSTYLRKYVHPSEGGMLPVRLFPARFKTERLGSIPNPSGIHP